MLRNVDNMGKINAGDSVAEDANIEALKTDRPVKRGNLETDRTTRRGDDRVIPRQRPQTSLGMRRQEPARSKEWCELTVTSFSLSNTKFQQKEDATVSNNCRPSSTSTMCRGTLYTSDADCFRTIHEMKKAYDTRVKSAPSVARWVSDSENHRQQDRIVTPIFWKTRDTHHRKFAIITGSEERLRDNDTRCGGSLMRSLLQTCDSGFKHSASCPYKCKGCFKACLASSDYLQKLKEEKEMASAAPQLWEYRRKLKFIVDKRQHSYE